VTPTKLLAQGAGAAALARARALRGDNVEDIVADPRLVAVAEDIAKSLGEMKGAAMKIGQALSFIDVSVIPEEYRTALSMLQSEAPAMPFAKVEKVIERELGGSPSEVFDWFSPRPIAAASIGQVHMAHLGDREVVVKVQYPGIAKAVEADLRNAALLSGIARVGQKMLVGLVGDVDIRAVIDEVRDRIGEELDYRIEARNQQEFAELFRDEPTIDIPEVLADYSTQRVLTTDYVDAMRWSAALEQPQELRDQWGQAIARFIQTSTLKHGIVNIDTHPGNYLFGEDGRVTFLDFGCVVRYTDDQRERVRRVVAAFATGDDDIILDALVHMGMLHDRNAFKPDALLAPLRRSLEPLHGPQPFRYSRDQLAEVIAEAMKLRVGVDELRLLRQVDCPPEFALLGRTSLGMEAVLSHLEASVDYQWMIDELLAGALPSPGPDA
jgi:predicted unusual protein kinase regulating ubiquinone biosynthesis (AarF/ABC1/UbiB family)